MNHASLFSGIGGPDLAAEWMGWNNIFHCEISDFNQRILKYYWPNAITYSDIKQTDFSIHRGTIDILTGGFPCQPYSLAGKRKGKEDDRHLWPEMLRAIREIQPSWIVGENVYGFINWSGGLVFEEVQTDLENEGYEVQAIILPACGVNAPHRRDRIRFVAHSNSCRNNNSSKYPESFWEQESEIQPRNGGSSKASRFSNEWTFTNTKISSGQGEYEQRQREGEFGRCDSANGINNFENFPTQSPICNGDDGLSSRLDSITFSKWRTESIKAGGNAIVPQVAFEIFKAIEKMHHM
jgi:DNA (cytosine-5)-methyltransferase 1